MLEELFFLLSVTISSILVKRYKISAGALKVFFFHKSRLVRDTEEKDMKSTHFWL